MDDPTTNKRLRIPDKTKMRNLTQFKNMTDEEYDLYWAQMAVGAVPVKEFETRVQVKLKELEEDYDFSDMKINDKLQLRAMCQAMIQYEDYEQIAYRLRVEGVDSSTIVILDKIGNLMNDLRNGISKSQDDLKITRKIRKGDKEASVISYLEELKEKARKFYEQKMFYIFCPKCNMLLGTLWTLYPDEDRNKLALVCHRKLENDQECGEKVIISTKEILKLKGTNNPDILPDVLK
jgi:hypothetical protein